MALTDAHTKLPEAVTGPINPVDTVAPESGSLAVASTLTPNVPSLSQVLEAVVSDNGDVVPNSQEDLNRRFNPERIAALTQDFLENGTGINLKEAAGERQYVVAYVNGDSQYADLGRVVETKVFSNWFEMPEPEVVEKYGGVYDPLSTFVCVFDLHEENPRPVGALRMVNYSPEGWFKDIRDFVASPDSPWLEDIKAAYFAEGEAYDPQVAWDRMLAANGDTPLDPATTYDVTSHSVMPGYGSHASDGGVSILFFHACMRWGMAQGKEDIVAIFDIKPFENLDALGGPFNAYKNIPDRAYDGPGLTRPAYCNLKVAEERFFAAGLGEYFVEGQGMQTTALLPDEYQPELYSNAAVGLRPLS